MNPSAPDVVVIGGSAGGIQALRAILQTLENVADTIVIVVLHRSPQDSPLVEVLQGYTGIPVCEPSTSPMTCRAGVITVAPAGYHLLVGNSRILLREAQTPVALYETGSDVRVHLTLDSSVAYSRPSLDVAFVSAAELVNSVTVVLLSCANEDGARGCEVVRAAGGRVILQDPATCESATAVEAAMVRVKPDHVADPHGIGRWLSQHVVRQR